MKKVCLCISFIAIFPVLFSISCASKRQQSLLFRDLPSPPTIIQETFAQEGKSDYTLINDDGYAFRLIYLCENHVLNFSEEPEKNPILVSQHPILDTPVEKMLSFDDRVRIWACIERKVRDEQSRIEDFKRKAIEERMKVTSELNRTLLEYKKLEDQIENSKRVAAQKQRQMEQMEEEARRAQKAGEERLRKAEEERKIKAEEERKIKLYKAGEKEDPPPPLTPAQVPPSKPTETGIFMAMKDTHVYETPTETAKIKTKVMKYDLFDVIHSRKDPTGFQWLQIILSERFTTERVKKSGWSPEEKPFWIKNKLLVWVYPGDLSKINNIRPIKIEPDLVYYTGKKAAVSNKPPFYEVTYEIKTEMFEKNTGWVEGKNGIPRPNKSIDDMHSLLNELSLTLWPIRIQNDVLAGNIRVGFSPEQVILSWGKPDHVNRTRTLVGIHEQWVYGENPFPRAYVYFENGMVKSWEFLKGGAR